MTSNILEYDWGPVTPDLYDKLNNEVTHSFCFEFRFSEKRNRAIMFVIGKVYWFDKHLPKNARHDIFFDIRGQDLNSSIIKEIENQVKDGIKSLNSKLKFNITFKQ